MTETLTRDLATEAKAKNGTAPGPEKPLTGWELLRSPMPPEALSPLSQSVGYGSGMTAIDKAFIYDRLNRSGLDWSIPPAEVHYEDMPREKERTGKDGGKYLASGFESTCTLTLRIDGRDFPGVGGDWNLGWGDARKGAFTDAMGRAAMLAGIGLEVWLDQMTPEQKAAVASKAVHDDDGKRKDEYTPRAKAAMQALGKEWPECPEHGNTLVAALSKEGKARVGCWKKKDGGYCPTVWFENKLPAEVIAAIKGASAPAVEAA